MTKYAYELLNAKTELIPIENSKSTILHIPMTTYLQENEKTSPDIFVRECQIELWEEVLRYHEGELNNHSIVTGNPGIGKSRSMSYFLRLLLSKKKPVVYEAKKDNTAIVFIPQNDRSYKVWITYNFQPESCSLLNDLNNYYLIDPKTPDDPVHVSAHTVLCASPNKAHYKEFFKIMNSDMWCMPVWTKEELKAVKSYFKINGKELSDKELESKYYIFGGRIRYIYGPFQEKNSKSLDIAIDILPFEKIYLSKLFSNPQLFFF